VLATALLVFTNESGFSHETTGVGWDVAVALAAFFALLLIASRTDVPSWSSRLAFGCAVAADGVAAFRIGGGAGALIVVAAIVLIPMRASRFGLPPLVLLASLAANYSLLRALADPQRASPLPGVEAVVAIALPVLTLPFAVRDEPLRLLRWGVWLTGTGMLALLTERYFIRVSASIAPDDVFITLAGAVLLLLSTVIRRDALSRVVAASGVAAIVLVMLLMLQGSHYVSDTAVSIDAAARAVLHGENPYVTVDIVEATRARGLSDQLFTPFADSNEVERRYPYPAGSFLPSTLLFALGLDDVRYGFLALLAALYLVLIFRVPRTFAPYVSGLALVDIMAQRQVALAGVEPSWALFLVLAIALPRLSGVFGGLSAAARQTAWLYLPFLAVDRARVGARALARWVVAVAIIFAVVNVPFAVGAPSQWLSDSTAPVFAAYVPLGFGVIRFSTDGPLPFAPRVAYTIALGIAYVLALWTYWRHRPAWRYGLAVLPVAPLYFAWRSLQNYFMFAPFFLVSLIAEDPEVRSQRM